MISPILSPLSFAQSLMRIEWNNHNNNNNNTTTPAELSEQQQQQQSSDFDFDFLESLNVTKNQLNEDMIDFIDGLNTTLKRLKLMMKTTNNPSLQTTVNGIHILEELKRIGNIYVLLFL